MKYPTGLIVYATVLIGTLYQLEVDLEFRHLKAFVAVAEELNFRRAADRLNMTQPPLSQTILQLEEELGVPLFTRSRAAGVAITPAGQAFLIAALRLLEDADKAKKTARRAHRGLIGSLRVGHTDDFDHGALPDLLADYSAAYPGIALNLTGGLSFNLAQSLHRREIDVLFTVAPVLPVLSRYPCLRLPSSRLIAVLPREHRLASLSRVPIAILAEEKLLLPGESDRSPFAGTVRRVFEDAGVRPPGTMTHMSTSLSVEMVRRGHGVLLASQESVASDRSGLTIVPVADDCAEIMRVLIWSPDAPEAAVEAMCELALHHFARASDENRPCPQSRPGPVKRAHADSG